MADWDDVRQLALALPETSERESRGNAQWRVKDKLFAWERPLRKPDLEALGDRAPEGPVLGAMVADLGEKEALLAEAGGVFFTTPHFNGFAAVLVHLERISVEHLRQVLVEAWMARAPKRLVEEHQDRLDTDVVVQVFGCQVLEPEEIRRLLAGIAGELGEIYVKSKNSSS